MKMTENLALKIAAVFVVFFASIGMVVGGGAAICANEMGLYSASADFYMDASDVSDNLSFLAESITAEYFRDPDTFITSLQMGYNAYSPAYSNVCLEIVDHAGNIIASNTEDLVSESETIASCMVFAVHDGEGGWWLVDSIGDGMADSEAVGGISVYVVSAAEIPPASMPDNYNLYVFLREGRHAFLYVAGVSALLLAMAFVYLCCGVGHIEGKPGITLNPQDKVPYDLYLSAMSAIIYGVASMTYIISDRLYHSDRMEYLLVFGSLMIGVFALLMLAVLLTSVTRFKYGHWWHNTVLWRVIKLCVAITKACVKGIINCFTALRYEWRVALAVITFSLVSISGGGPALCALAVTLVLCCLSANRLRRLFEGAEEIAGGNVDYKIEEDGLHGQLRNHAVNLNSIAGGLGIAVEQRIKSERLKTELITNVSHDIKTPLTSIINYVDLLKKEPLTGKAHEYANTLERHANRLKKLTEDLVEASKAATGNIKAELIPMNVCELINQAVGEYSERLEKSRIEPVVAIPEAPRYILADGRLIWRVIENLLSNAAKYAQPGTRLYISLIERHGRVVIEMKNISRERLNIDAEELTERFVRGDSSRHTDGSGLGLNIARSLTELQHGRMDIEIDGDLFKVSLAFESLDDQMDFLDELPIDI